MFDTFPNAHDGYGSFDDLESATVADAAEFFDRYYAPGNAVLCGRRRPRRRPRPSGWSSATSATCRPAPAPPRPRLRRARPDRRAPRVLRGPARPAAGRRLGLAGAGPDRATSPATCRTCARRGAHRRRRVPAGAAAGLNDRSATRRRLRGLHGRAVRRARPHAAAPQAHHPPAVPVEKVLAAVARRCDRLARTASAPTSWPRRGPHRRTCCARPTPCSAGRCGSRQRAARPRRAASELAARLAEVTAEQVQAAAATCDPDTAAVLELRADGRRASERHAGPVRGSRRWASRGRSWCRRRSERPSPTGCASSSCAAGGAAGRGAAAGARSPRPTRPRPRAYTARAGRADRRHPARARRRMSRRGIAAACRASAGSCRPASTPTGCCFGNARQRAGPGPGHARRGAHRRHLPGRRGRRRAGPAGRADRDRPAPARRPRPDGAAPPPYGEHPYAVQLPTPSWSPPSTARRAAPAARRARAARRQHAWSSSATSTRRRRSDAVEAALAGWTASGAGASRRRRPRSCAPARSRSSTGPAAVQSTSGSAARRRRRTHPTTPRCSWPTWSSAATSPPAGWRTSARTRATPTARAAPSSTSRPARRSSSGRRRHRRDRPGAAGDLVRARPHGARRRSPRPSWTRPPLRPRQLALGISTQAGLAEHASALSAPACRSTGCRAPARRSPRSPSTTCRRPPAATSRRPGSPPSWSATPAGRRARWCALAPRRASTAARDRPPGAWPRGRPPRPTGARPGAVADRARPGAPVPRARRTRPAGARSGCSSSTQGTVPVVEGPDGPQLVWDEQPALPAGAVYLGEADGVPYAAVRGERPLTVGGRPVDAWAGLRDLGADLGDLDAGLLVHAIGILEWHDRHRFSPLTGAPTTVERGGWVQRDPDDGTEFFPRTDPAVIMLVHDGGDRARARPAGRSGRPAGSRSWPGSSSRGSRPRRRSSARSPRRSACGSPTSGTSAASRGRSRSR